MVGTDEMFEDGEASYENVMNIGEGVRYEVLDDALKQLSVRTICHFCSCSRYARLC